MPPTPAPGHRHVNDQQSWIRDNSYLMSTVYTATVVAIGSDTSMTKTTTYSLASGYNNSTFFAATLSYYVDDTAPGDNVSYATAQLFLVLLLTNFIFVSIVVLSIITDASAFPIIPSSSTTTRRLLSSHAAYVFRK